MADQQDEDTEARKQLKSWPYAFEYLRQTMDPELIESHATVILSRALNIGGVTAFVGAGASMSYGRIGWEAMVRMLLDQAMEIAANNNNAEEVKRLHENLVDLTKNWADLKSEDYLIIFQLCEQITAEVRRQWADKDGDPPTPSRQKLIDMMSDDSGHAIQILEQAEVLGQARDADIAKFFKELVESDGGEKQCAGAFTVDAFFIEVSTWLRNITCGDTTYNIFKNIIQDHANDPKKERAIRLPQRRYLFAAALSALRHDKKTGGGCEIPLNYMKETVKKNPPSTQREDIFHLYRDPIRLLSERLEIYSFLTTNYDREIARYLDARTSKDAATKASASPCSEPAPFSEIVFDGSRTGEVIAFLAGATEKRPGVLHLHGSVKGGPEDGEPGQGLLVTESDYQCRYFRAGPDRDLVNNAIQFAFGAHPLLFVGLGMTEGDLLRPLREFMSTPRNFGKHTAIALMPGLQSPEMQIKEKISLLGRYGVYATHYGRATVSLGRTEKLINDWLHQMHVITRAILKYLDLPMRTDKDDEGYSAEISSHKEKYIEALKRKYGEHAYNAFSPVSHIEWLEASDDDELNTNIELDVIHHAVSYIYGLPSISADIPRLQGEFRTWKIAVEGAWSTIISTFASAKLLKVRLDWDGWRKDWYRIPRARSAASAASGRRRGQSPLVTNFDLLLHHAVQVPSRPDGNHHRTRFYTDAPSRAFLDLRSALRNSEEFKEIRGRRILLLVGRRGAGKGSLFGNLMNNEGMGRLPHLLKEMQPARARPQYKWQGVALFNLSFTQQVMPVFERLTEFLYRNLVTILDRPTDKAARDRLEECWTSLGTNHLARLRAMMEEWAGLGKQQRVARRLFVCIDAIGIFFDEKGRAKNGQLGCALEAIFAEEFATAPIDFMIICWPSRLPIHFRPQRPGTNEAAYQPGTRIPLLHLSSPRRPPADAVSDVERLPEILTEKTGDHEVGGGVHFLHSTRASTFALSHHPRVAFLIARNIMCDKYPDFLARIGASRDGRDVAKVFASDNAHAVRVILRKSLFLFERDGTSYRHNRSGLLR